MFFCVQYFDDEQFCHILTLTIPHVDNNLGIFSEKFICVAVVRLLITFLAFDVQEDPANKTFFSEIIASISDAQFSPDGRFIVARDYMTLKIWDVKMESKPVKVLYIHEGLRPKLCDLYENDCIFDKFECSFSGCGKYV